MKSFLRKTGFLLTALLVVLLISAIVMYFRDTDGPQISLASESGLVSARPISIEIGDEGSALKNLQVVVQQGDLRKVLLAKEYEPEVQSSRETVTLKGVGLKDGTIQLTVVAGDRSIYHFGAGNQSEQVFSLTFDGTPPRLNVLSRAHNINQGGSALIIYDIAEDVEKTGMRVGETFFPGYQLDSGSYACLFAFPHDMAESDFTPTLVAVDRAGNEGRGGFYYHANTRRFRHDRINISDNFLAAKMPQFEQYFPGVDSLVEIFLKVNRELRAENRRALRDYGLQTLPSPQWTESFERMARAASKAQFGEKRSYFYKGEKIDEQTHLGVDLASISQAPILAANHGRVVFADFMGIYGNCVIVDHGLGLQSLYAHLTSYNVEAGQEVRKNEQIGTSGATGMAGGDHLHLGMTLSGVPVNPVEWWDAQWLQNNITEKLK